MVQPLGKAGKYTKRESKLKTTALRWSRWNKKAVPAEWIIGGQRDSWMVSAKGPCMQWDWEKPNREETGSAFLGRRQAWDRRGSHMYMRVETSKRKRSEVSCSASWIQWIQILTVIVSVGKRMKNQLNTGEKASIYFVFKFWKPSVTLKRGRRQGRVGQNPLSSTTYCVQGLWQLNWKYVVSSGDAPAIDKACFGMENLCLAQVLSSFFLHFSSCSN